MGRPKKHPDPPNPYDYLPGDVGYSRTDLEQILKDGPEQFFAADGPRDFDHALIAWCVCDVHRVPPPIWVRGQIMDAFLGLLEGREPRACLPLPWFDPAPKRRPSSRTELRALRMANEVRHLRATRPHLLKQRVYEIVGENLGASWQHVKRAYLKHERAFKTATSTDPTVQSFSKKT